MSFNNASISQEVFVISDKISTSAQIIPNSPISTYNDISDIPRKNITSESTIPNISSPTDYNLKELRLISSTIGNLNLKPYLVEMNYFEDIFNSSISGKLVLSDSVGVILMGGLNGTESLTMEFAAGAGGISIFHTFRLFSISERHFDISSNFETYVLNFCSEEFLLSEKYRLSKSYKNKTISDIIKNILNIYLQSPKKFTYDTSYGKYDFVLPNKKIFETINWLSTYAQPSSKGGADMLFYENSEGYNFKSLQSLYKSSPSFEYSYIPKNIPKSQLSDSFNTEQYTIYRVEILNNFDTLDAIHKGTFHNRVITIDTLTRKSYSNDFNYKKYSSDSLNPIKVNSINGTKNDYTDRFNNHIYNNDDKERESGALRLSICNSNQQNSTYIKSHTNSVVNDFMVEKYLPNRVAQISLMNYNRIKILVPGNCDLLVGKTIEVNIMETAILNPGDTKNRDVYLSGKYLITAVRHIINTTRYTTVVELAKESNIIYGT